MAWSLRTLFTAALALAAGTTACSGAEPGDGKEERADDLSCADVIVAGTVVREETPTTYNEELAFPPEAHAVIELRRHLGEDVGAPIFLAIGVPVRGLPFDFELCGDASEVFAARGTLLLGIDGYNRAGRDLEVGDLISELRNRVERPTVGARVLVGGLEACDSPAAGGACVDPAGG